MMPYDDEREAHDVTPSLEEMTVGGLKLLQRENAAKGFLLLIEGGRIDHANHDSTAARALSETLAMERAVQAVLEAVDMTETLVLVTADHSHTLSLGGYPGRGADITGVSVADSGWVFKAEDGQGLPVLSYANGPGFHRLAIKGDQDDWRALQREQALKLGSQAAIDHVYPSAVPLERETHGGDDVGIWAAGPWSHLVHGVHQQSFIAHLISHAACIGPHSREDCKDRS